MTTGPKKSLYYYVIFGLAIWGLFPMMVALANLKGLLMNQQLFENITHTVNTLAIIVIEFYFISEIFKHSQGYTTVVTTEYNLFKCRQKGEEEEFMMFADSEEELEKFFEITQPDKSFLIQPADMKGKSIKMKIFNES